MPWELEPLLGAETTRLGLRRLKPIDWIEDQLRPEPKAGFCKVAALESSIYMRNQLLRDADWASMAHSLEVRVPLVDATLLHELASITPKQASQPKRLLAKSPYIQLPRAVVDRAKTGFTTPIQQWLQRDKSIQKWRRVPALATDPCAWARRWAFQVAMS
jgi:asparagine synthase (glutamine-hydrolysing)